MKAKLASVLRMAVLATGLLGTHAANASVIYDADGDILRLTDVAVTLSGTTTHYSLFYEVGTFDAVTGSPLGTSAWWPYAAANDTQAFNWMSAAINAIADTLDAEGVGDAEFTNGLSDGSGSVNGYVPYDFGTITTGTGTFGCVTCVHARGVWWTNSPSGWSPDGGATFISTPDTDVATWAVFVPVSAVPLPASGLLMVSGLAGLLGLTRRKTNPH